MRPAARALAVAVAVATVGVRASVTARSGGASPRLVHDAMPVAEFDTQYVLATKNTSFT
jgi:hypothetical protein